MDSQLRSEIKDLFTKSKLEEIEKKLSQCKDLNDTDYLAFLYFFYYCTDNYSEQKDTFRQLELVFCDNLSDLYFHLGKISHEIHVLHLGFITSQDTLKYYRLSLKENPDNIYALFEICKFDIESNNNIQKGIETIRDITSKNDELYEMAKVFYLNLYPSRFSNKEIKHIIKELIYFLNENDTQSRLKLADFYKSVKKYNDAITELKKINSIKPEYLTYSVNSMFYELYKNIDDFDNALSFAQKSSPELEAKCLFEFKQYEQALNKYEELLKNKKHSINIQAVKNTIGLCYCELNNYSEAEKYFKEVQTESNKITNEKDYNDSLLYLSNLYEKQEQYELAIESVNRAIQLIDDSDYKSSSSLLKDNILRRAELYCTKHINVYKKSKITELDKNTVDSQTINDIISRFNDSKLFNSIWKSKLKKDIEKIIEISKDEINEVEELERKVEVFEEHHTQEINKHIVIIIEKAFENGLKEKNLLFSIAQAYFSLKKYSECIKCYEELLQDEPTNPTYLNNIAVAYIEKGDESNASNYYTQALENQKGYDKNTTISENFVRSLITKSEKDPTLREEALKASEDFFKTVITKSNQFSKHSSNGLFNLRYTTLYKYRPFNTYTMDGIANNYLYFADLPSLNDPLDIPLIEFSKGKDYEFQEMNNSDVGICSLSLESNHSLMWAHYADSFKGICIGYYLLKLPKIVGWDVIRYASEQNKFSRISKEYGLLDAGLYTKHINWEYEKEVRLLTYKYDDKTVKYHYPIKLSNDNLIEGYINEITIGYKFPKSNLTILKAIIDKLNKERLGFNMPTITIYRTELDKKHPFKLKKTKIFSDWDNE